MPLFRSKKDKHEPGSTQATSPFSGSLSPMSDDGQLPILTSVDSNVSLSSAVSAVSENANSCSAFPGSNTSSNLPIPLPSASSDKIHRSRSMSQRFKNMFIHEDHSHHVADNSSSSISRVNSSSSMLKVGRASSTTSYNNSSGVALSSQSSSTKLHKSNAPPIPHVPALPIPNRGPGPIKQSTITSPISKVNKSPLLQPHLNGLPLKQEEESNELDEVLEFGLKKHVDNSSNSINNNHNFHNNNHSNSRPRSSTVAGGSNYKSHMDDHIDDQTEFNNSASLFMNTLKHSQTVNYGSTHIHNQRDKVIKVKSGRICLYDYGRAHEHDYQKYRTQVSKSNNLFGWMKRKEGEDEKLESIEHSVSLLPDKYSHELIVLKNNPKNYIWNYDDDDEPQDLNEGNLVNINDDYNKNGYSDDELDKHRKKHGIISPIEQMNNDIDKINKNNKMDDNISNNNKSNNKNDNDNDNNNNNNNDNNNDNDDSDSDYYSSDDDSDSDDEFDDSIDNMMIEPLIGQEQVFLVDKMMDKIEHQEKFAKKLQIRKQNGNYKETLEEKYGTIKGVIGKGSFGTVCISTKEINKQPIYFAIKQLCRREKETLKHFGNRVTSEFMISSALTHQAIIKVYDLMFDPKTHIYSQVMEYIPCGDLFQLIKTTNGLDIVECDCFFKQILNAVTYLHSVGISHNDLKVENLLLTRKGQLKIIDFGTSAVFKTQWEKDIQLSHGICGSERYISPEQHEDKDYDPRLGDVWALGIIYLTMYNGYYAWESAKQNDEGYVNYLERRAIYDYSTKSTSASHQFKCIRKGTFSLLENIKGCIMQSWIQQGGEPVSRDCKCEPCIDRSNEPNNIIGVGGVSAVSSAVNSRQHSPEPDIDFQEQRQKSQSKKEKPLSTAQSINDSRRYVLYNILNPDPIFRMRTYQIWQSEWIKNTKVCDAGRGYISYENYLEMTMKSVAGAAERDEVEKKKKKNGLFGL
ncbi:hypothetical protein DAMA08_040020 [Martiniozyma asiatica (nom. inval.)]|nr:hypothetical protein DAMA08_040020 [Martiniozyma asiatica]